MGKIRDGFVIPFNMPAIVELGTATGFDFEFIDQAALGHDALTQDRDRVAWYGGATSCQLSQRAPPNGLEDTAQFKLEVDEEKAQALGISLLTSIRPFQRRWVGLTLTTSSTVVA
ncbi:efflux RND transporter permease subunit [Escherichia coli]